MIHVKRLLLGFLLVPIFMTANIGNVRAGEPLILVKVVIKSSLSGSISAAHVPTVIVSEARPYADIIKVESVAWEGTSYVGRAQLTMGTEKPYYQIKAEAKVEVKGKVFKGIGYSVVKNPIASLGFTEITMTLVDY